MMLRINQKHIILGLPMHFSWDIKSRFRFCVIYLQLSKWMFWRNWSLVSMKGERTIETHDEYFFQTKKQIILKLYKIRWNGLVLVESLQAALNDNYKEIDIQPIKTKEFQFELEPIKLKAESEIKIIPSDFKIQLFPLEVRTNLKSLSFKGLNSEL